MKSKGAMAMKNKLEKIGQNSFMDNFVKTDDILNDMCGIIAVSYTHLMHSKELRKKIK